MDVLLPSVPEAIYTRSKRKWNNPRRGRPDSRSPPERLRHDLLAALTGLLVGDAEVAGEGGFFR